MRRPLKHVLVPLGLVLLSLGLVTWAGADDSAAIEPVIDVVHEAPSAVESGALIGDAELAPATACSTDLEQAPTFGVPAPVFGGDVCVGSCRTNSDCDQFCGPGDGGCDLNPANPCYRQCICLL